SALDVLDRTPETAATAVDTSMQTDAYRAEDLWRDDTDEEQASASSSGDADAEDGAADDGASGAGAGAGAGKVDARDRAEDDAADPGDTHDALGVHGTNSAAGSGRAETAAEEVTQDLTEISGVRGSNHDGTVRDAPVGEQASDIDSAEEAQRAARAALQRWTNSASE